MLRLATDEDVHGGIVRGLLRVEPEIDLMRVKDAGLSIDGRRVLDPRILEWAAGENRVLITQDRSTLVDAAWQRVAAERPMPGVLAVRPQPISEVIEAILLVAHCYSEEEMRNQVIFVPL
jgi:hypothetical protein